MDEEEEGQATSAVDPSGSEHLVDLASVTSHNHGGASGSDLVAATSCEIAAPQGRPCTKWPADQRPSPKPVRSRGDSWTDDENDIFFGELQINMENNLSETQIRQLIQQKLGVSKTDKQVQNYWSRIAARMQRLMPGTRQFAKLSRDQKVATMLLWRRAAGQDTLTSAGLLAREVDTREIHRYLQQQRALQ